MLLLLGAGCWRIEDSLPSSAGEVPREKEIVRDDEDLAIDQEEVLAGHQEIAAMITVDTVDERSLISALPDETSFQEIQMEAGNFFFTPSLIVVKTGQQVQITFTTSSSDHLFVIDELDLSFSIANGSTLAFTAPSTPGRYLYYCDVGPHRTLGMEGVLIVEE